MSQSFVCLLHAETDFLILQRSSTFVFPVSCVSTFDNIIIIHLLVISPVIVFFPLVSVKIQFQSYCGKRQKNR